MTSGFRQCALLAASVALFACGQNKQAGMGDVVPEYAMISVEPTTTLLYNSYPATLQGRQDIEIRPNVSGFITQLCVDEGAVVKKGQTLFVIDPVPFEEAANAARAAVEVAKASVATAQLTVDNKRELARKNIISQFDLQTAENTLASAKANLASAKAQLVNAENNLSYTRVKSPADGVVGQIPYRVGSLVSPSMATPLTIVSDISEMFAYFSLNEKEVYQLLSGSEGSTKTALSQLPEVELKLPNNAMYPLKGRIETASGVYSTGTGSSRFRATFKNPDNILRSGGTGVVMIPVQSDSSLVVPQHAVQELQDKRFVFVLTDSSTLHQTQIEVLPINDGQDFVVTEGLKPGDRIAVEGVGISIRDGIKVKPITPEESAAKLQGAIRQAAGAAAQQAGK